MEKILFVEDDVQLAGILCKGMELSGLKVIHQDTLDDLEKTIESLKPDVLLLDLEIGNRNSSKEIAGLHRRFPQLFIIIASSHTDSETIALCLDSGAHYFIKKPYEIAELTGVIRKFGGITTDNTCIPIGRYTLDTTKRALLDFNNETAFLSPKEYAVLKILLDNKNNLVTRQEFFNKIWKGDFAEPSLNNHIHALRSALKKDSQIKILTRVNVGYILQLPE